jgi:outer membrane protein OmpA-like peptidoglycan-associated protein
MYQADNIDALVQGRNNDYMGYAGFGIRYKIGANKNRGSIKTVSIMDHNPDRTDRVVSVHEKQMKELSAKVDNVTDMLNKNIVPKLEAITKAQEDNTDTDLDGVPDNRDRHPNTPTGSFVNYYGEPLTEAEINKILGTSSNKPESTIYYELNSYNVTKDSELAIAQVASKLYNNPNYRAEIIGYCDNSGSEEFNQKLSLKRAETVKNILVKQYGIDANRISVVGKGKTQGPKDKFIVNRRCDVFIIK